MDDTDVVRGVFGELPEGIGAVAVAEYHGCAVVAARSDGGIERYLPEERHLDLGGELAPAAFSEEVVFGPTIGTDEPAHVFDDPQNWCVVFAEHFESFAGVVDGHVLWRGDDNRSRDGHRLKQCELGVAGPRRKVDHHVI